MSLTIELMERVRERTTTRTDYAIAKALGISTQRVYKYVHGQGDIQDDDTIARAAELIGENPAALLARFHAAKANGPTARLYWQKLERLAIKSAAAVIMVGMLGGAAMTATLPHGNAETAMVSPVFEASHHCILC